MNGPFARANGTRPLAHPPRARRSETRGRGASNLLGYALSAAAAIVALLGLKLAAPLLTSERPPAAVAPAISRPEPRSAAPHRPPAGEQAADAAPAAQAGALPALSETDRGILAGLSGSWRSESSEMVVDAAHASLRVRHHRELGGKALRIVQISHPFMIVEGEGVRYTVLLQEGILMIYNASLFPPVEYRRG